MDKVFIQKLSVLATIGVYAWEKEIKQRLEFDLEMGFDNRPAAANDAIDLALDYSDVAKRVTAHVAHTVVELVETLAEQVAALILQDQRVAYVTVRLSKPTAVANAAAVGVEITRQQPS
ncbi:MAG: dihydroneopterin aldolase [Aeromonas sp.]